MQKIELRSIQDLEKLEHLTGKGSLSIKVYSTFSPLMISAIDLKDFQGTIDLFFEKTEMKPFLVNLVETPSKKWIFKNIEHVKINGNIRAMNRVQYQVVPKRFDIAKKEDFHKALALLVDQPKVIFNILDDIAMDSFPWQLFQNFKGKIHFEGNYHQFYFTDPSTWQKFIEQNRVSFSNMSITCAKRILSIKSVKDLNKISSFQAGTYVVVFENDLENVTMESLCLGNFLGTLVILGKGKKLHNVCIRSFHSAHGFISSIHPTSNLYLSNLKFQGITFERYLPCEAAGVILGKRGFVNEQARGRFMPGWIHISNCSIKKAMLPNSINTGIYVGEADDAMSVLDTFVKHVTDANNQPIYARINYNNYYLDSFYRNSEDEIRDRKIALEDGYTTLRKVRN
ncbi:MAG: hypothetical protein HFI08_03870 [Bacilli bacterium]|jgi:hypothetical protein|nr:hypothetical protein [Bacilli bacterium]